MITATAIGNVGHDAEIRYTASGTAITSWSLGCSVGFGQNKKTEWIRCTIFGKRGEALAPHITKGSKVIVSGSLHLHTWDKQDGSKGFGLELTVANDGFEFAGGKESGGQQRRQAAKKQAPQQDGLDDDIPF